jgi:hypothetical protein
MSPGQVLRSLVGVALLNENSRLGATRQDRVWLTLDNASLPNTTTIQYAFLERSMRNLLNPMQSSDPVVVTVIVDPASSGDPVLSTLRVPVSVAGIGQPVTVSIPRELLVEMGTTSVSMSVLPNGPDFQFNDPSINPITPPFAVNIPGAFGFPVQRIIQNV